MVNYAKRIFGNAKHGGSPLGYSDDVLYEKEKLIEGSEPSEPDNESLISLIEDPVQRQEIMDFLWDQFQEEEKPIIKYCSLTFVIHPECRINRRKWSTYDQNKQKKLMLDMLTKYLLFTGYKIYKVFYELTKAGNVHVHSTLKIEDDVLYAESLLNSKLKYGKYQCFKLDWLVSKADEIRWAKYIRKSQ